MSEYYYLVSSLPMLMFGDPCPMSVEQFMISSSDWLSEKKINLLKNLSLVPDDNSDNNNLTVNSNNVIGKWNEWET